MPKKKESKADERRHVNLAYASFAIFADDGTINLKELNHLLKMALSEGGMDESEREILAGIFNRVLEEDVSGAVWQRIQTLRHLHGI